MGLIDREYIQANRWMKKKKCYAVVRDGEYVTVSLSTRSGKKLRHEIIYDDRADANLDAWKECVCIVQAELQSGSAWLASALPVHLGIVRKLSAPFPSESKALKVFPSLLDIDIPFPLEQCDYAFLQPQHTPSGHVETTALAVRHEELDAFLDEFEKLNVRPSYVDHEGLVLWTQCLLEQPVSAAGDTRIVVWLGRTRTIIMVGEGRGLEAVHSIRSGADELASGHGITGWARRLQRFLKTRISADKNTEKCWIWAGPGASQADLLDAVVDAVAAEFSPEKHVLPEPEGILSRGLASRILAPARDPFNFLSGDREDPGMKIARNRRNMFTAVYFSVCGLLLVVLSMGFEFFLKKQDREYQAVIDRQYLDIVGAPNLQRGQEVLLAGRALETIQLQNKPFIEVFDPSLCKPAGAFLRAAYQQDVHIKKFSIDGEHIEVEGLMPDWELSGVLQSVVEAEGYEVEITKGEGNQSRTSFMLKATLAQKVPLP